MRHHSPRAWPGRRRADSARPTGTTGCGPGGLVPSEHTLQRLLGGVTGVELPGPVSRPPVRHETGQPSVYIPFSAGKRNIARRSRPLHRHPYLLRSIRARLARVLEIRLCRVCRPWKAQSGWSWRVQRVDVLVSPREDMHQVVTLLVRGAEHQGNRLGQPLG